MQPWITLLFITLNLGFKKRKVLFEKKKREKNVFFAIDFATDKWPMHAVELILDGKSEKGAQGSITVN